MTSPFKLTFLFLLCCLLAALLPGAKATWDEFANPPAPNVLAALLPPPPPPSKPKYARRPRVEPRFPDDEFPPVLKRPKPRTDPDDATCFSWQLCMRRVLCKI